MQRRQETRCCSGVTVIVIDLVIRGFIERGCDGCFILVGYVYDGGVFICDEGVVIFIFLLDDPSADEGLGFNAVAATCTLGSFLLSPVPALCLRPIRPIVCV
jgi:hypothetical protein